MILENRIFSLLKKAAKETPAKIAFAAVLLRRLQAEAHRVLVFSRSRAMLDLLEDEVILPAGFKYLRLDGRTTDSSDRHRLISKFNRRRDIFCFLITTQCGGVVRPSELNQLLLFLFF